TCATTILLPGGRLGCRARKEDALVSVRLLVGTEKACSHWTRTTAGPGGRCASRRIPAGRCTPCSQTSEEAIQPYLRASPVVCTGPTCSGATTAGTPGS